MLCFREATAGGAPGASEGDARRWELGTDEPHSRPAQPLMEGPHQDTWSETTRLKCDLKQPQTPLLGCGSW